LFDLLGIAICATFANVNTFEEMELFGIEREDQFRQFLDLPHAIPIHDTFNRVFQMLDETSFQALLIKHAASPEKDF
jgi:hypothetical protein